MTEPAKRRKVRRAKAKTPLRRRKPRARAAAAPEPSAAIPGGVSRLLEAAGAGARRRADEVRARHPDETPRAVGERLVRSQANRAGLAGGATGALALVALPLGLPAGVAVSLFFEA